MITGRCFCKSVRFVAEGPVLWSGHCHCESCRRAVSAAYASFLGVPRSGVTWKGDLSEHITSQGTVTRRFCAKCGTQMSYENAIWPEETHLYAASLDDPAWFVPQAHYHFAEKLPWVVITDDLPKHTGSADG